MGNLTSEMTWELAASVCLGGGAALADSVMNSFGPEFSPKHAALTLFEFRAAGAFVFKFCCKSADPIAGVWQKDVSHGQLLVSLICQT